jgi:hypothetical protein
MTRNGTLGDGAGRGEVNTPQNQVQTKHTYWPQTMNQILG